MQSNAEIPGSARVSRVGDRVLAILDFPCDALPEKRLFRRDAETKHARRARYPEFRDITERIIR